MPAGDNKGRPVVGAVLGALEDGVAVVDLQADRGMTTLDPENFARPLRQADVNVQGPPPAAARPAGLAQGRPHARRLVLQRQDA